MKFGLCINWRGATIDFTREIALEADKLGLEYLWLSEAWGMEATSTAGYLLGITRRVKIGAGILNVYSRSAALIGMACATLDQIAPNRFLLGLGSSGKTVVENWHGASFTKPLQRTREYVEIIRRVVRGEDLEFSGEVLNLSGLRLYTKPGSNNQEIYIGAIGDRNLTIAAEILRRGYCYFVSTFKNFARSRSNEKIEFRQKREETFRVHPFENCSELRRN